MKVLYYITMILIITCIVTNVYWLVMNPQKSVVLIIVNTITPVIVSVYLFLLIRRKKDLKKKFNEEFFKLFSKN